MIDWADNISLLLAATMPHRRGRESALMKVAAYNLPDDTHGATMSPR